MTPPQTPPPTPPQLRSQTSAGMPAGSVDTPGVRGRVNTAVFTISALLITAVSVWAMFWPDSAATVLSIVVAWISKWFGAFYIVLATAILGFVFFLGFSHYGKVKLGPQNAKPEYSTFAWASMLFAAGIGTDIMFFAVAEPVSQYMAPPVGQPETLDAAREATVWTLFHYGITGWGMYALMGIALAYFAYRHRQPLAVRSALRPVFGRMVEGVLGHCVDAAAVIGTIFGVAVTLGIGVVQLNVGLQILFGIQQSLGVQIALITVAIAIATLSATSGIDRGIRILSQLNVFLAIGLAGWVLVTGKTDFLLNAMVMNIGDFISSFPQRTLDTFAYSTVTEWMSAWTLFFWAWWVAWASFVGMFLARISRGRTLREFVLGTMVIPFTYVLMWISIFGNAAIERVRSGDRAFGEMTMTSPELGFYSLLQSYPLPTIMIALATVVGLLFYVTSADSGALVMANLCSHLPTVRDDARPWLRIFWACATGILTVAMLIVGGIPALQNATIITGLPFAFALIFVMIGLLKVLRRDDREIRSRSHSQLNVATSAPMPELGSASWRDHLARAFDQVSPTQAVGYIDRVVVPALTAIVGEFTRNGRRAHVLRGDECDRLLGAASEIHAIDEDMPIYYRIAFVAIDDIETASEAGGGENHGGGGAVGLGSGVGSERDRGDAPFVYEVFAIAHSSSVYGTMLTQSRDRSTRVEVHIPGIAQDYDVMGYSGEAIISDVLRHFDRHLEYCRTRALEQQAHATQHESSWKKLRERLLRYEMDDVASEDGSANGADGENGESTQNTAMFVRPPGHW